MANALVCVLPATKPGVHDGACGEGTTVDSKIDSRARIFKKRHFLFNRALQDAVYQQTSCAITTHADSCNLVYRFLKIVTRNRKQNFTRNFYCGAPVRATPVRHSCFDPCIPPCDLRSSMSSLFADASLQPAAAITLQFDEVQLDVSVKKWFGLKRSRTLRVLHGVRGIFEPGKLSAILGSSGTQLLSVHVVVYHRIGSGKTSLLNALSGRLQDGSLSGSMLCSLTIQS